MNPFEQCSGIRLNGLFYPKADLQPLTNIEGLSDFELEILQFAGRLLDDKERMKVETSGSTGEPKVMKFPKTAIGVSAKTTNQFFGMTPKSTAMLALPMRYIAGKMMVARAVLGGYNLLAVKPGSTPLSHAGKEAIDLMPLTPYQAAQSVEETPAALKKVKAVLIGGGQVSEALHKRLVAMDIKAYLSFGMTETLSHFALAPIAEGEVIYRPMKGVEIKVKKHGKLAVKWKGITDGWLLTNDLAEENESGFVWLGRSDNLINSGGVKVIPELVEKKLAHLISTHNYFVAGVAHKKLGQEVALFIENRGKAIDVSLSDVQHALAERPFWQPRKIYQVERFEYTPSGKIKRKEVVKASARIAAV